MKPAAGDLALITRVCGCPHSLRHLGQPVTVLRVFPLGEWQGIQCGYCGLVTPGRGAMSTVSDGRGEWELPHTWLVKISPPGTPIETRNDEVIHA